MRDSALDRLAALAENDSTPFMEAALAVNACIDDAFDEGLTRERLDDLAERHGGRGAAWEFLEAEGFGGGPPVDMMAGSRIDTLLETRRGLPITLAALIAHLAQKAGLRAEGINFPGHFLVRVEQTLVDPVALEPRTPAECLAALPADADRSGALAVATPRDVLLRMFNNLKYHHAGRAEFHRALEMVDCQLRVLPRHAGLVFEQGEYWLRLGSVSGAREMFERILSGDEVDADEAVRAMARRRLDELGDRSDTLH